MVRWGVAIGAAVFGLIGWALIDVTGLVIGLFGGAWIGLAVTGPLALRRSIERRVERSKAPPDAAPPSDPAPVAVPDPAPAAPDPGPAGVLCPSCRGTVPSDARVCGYCGTRLGG